MRIEWLEAATEDADGIADHISIDNPSAARAVLLRIDRVVGRLALFPHVGRKGQIVGTRELVVSGTPYIVIYSVAESTVSIANVVHGARLWPLEDE